MSNILRREKKVAVLNALVEGCSVRSTERMTGVHRDTILRLLVRVGDGCDQLLDEKMMNLNSTRLECDELWSFIGKKQRHVGRGDNVERVGDAWTFIAIDSDTKIVPCFLVGKRTPANTKTFIADVASRLRNRVQLSTDGLKMYVEAIRESRRS